LRPDPFDPEARREMVKKVEDAIMGKGVRLMSAFAHSAWRVSSAMEMTSDRFTALLLIPLNARFGNKRRYWKSHVIVKLSAKVHLLPLARIKIAVHPPCNPTS